MIAPAFGVLFDGFAYGMLLFLLSVGLSVTLGMMNFVNLAHGSFAMLGAYVVVTLMGMGWPFFATLPCAFLVAAVVSVAFERSLFRRLYRASDLRQVLMTLGLAFISVAAAAWFYGTMQQPVRLPAYLRSYATFMGINFSIYRLFLIAVALAIEIVGLDPNFAFTYLIYVLIVVAVGGLGSIRGSLLAAIVLGVSDAAGKYYIPTLGAFLIYLVMVGMMLWRPSGLFGRR